MAARLKGWRYKVFIGGFVGAVSTFMYISAIRPMMNPEPYKQIRAKVAPKLHPKSEGGV